jgi:hypothetical protein
MPHVPPAAYDHAYALVQLMLGSSDHVVSVALIVGPKPRIVISVAIEPDEPAADEPRIHEPE